MEVVKEKRWLFERIMEDEKKIIVFETKYGSCKKTIKKKQTFWPLSESLKRFTKTRFALCLWSYSRSNELHKTLALKPGFCKKKTIQSIDNTMETRINFKKYF